MPILCDETIYSVTRKEHLIHNDFFLRYLEFKGEPMPSEITFTCLAGPKLCCEVRYQAEEIARRFQYGKEETARYRQSSLGRILGRTENLENAFIHEYFSFFASEAATRLHIQAKCGERTVEKSIDILPYESPNQYRFPLRGTVLVTDTYPSVNSHRWCRNSEFAFDVGAFDDSLENCVIRDRPVLAACEGIVEEVFDGLDDTDDSTDMDELERLYGERARIDGNHVLVRHAHGEYSLYSHLSKGSVLVRAGDKVAAGQEIGRVGSSGSSFLPHLHFHVMREGITGPGVPIHFEDCKTILGEPCLLDDTVNLVRKSM